MRFACVLILLTACAGVALAAEADDGGIGGEVQIVPRARPVVAAAAAANPLPKADIRTETNVVLVPVTVTDRLNRFVMGLDRDDFQIFEDKIQQQIVSFGCDDAPLSIGIVFDTSGSMGPKLERSRAAVAEFLKTANPDDEAFLVEFSDRPDMAVPMTHNLAEIQNRLVGVRPKGRTALYDSVYLALNALKKAHNPRKALLLITDGGDNRSRYTQSEVKGLLEEADVQLYAIGIYESANKRRRTPEEFAGPRILDALSAPTGGRHFVVDNLAELPDVAEKIGIELHNQYVVGYTPSNPERDGKYRKIGVKLVPPAGLTPLFASWRTGYTAPTQ